MYKKILITCVLLFSSIMYTENAFCLQPEYLPVLPVRNYKHWQKLEKVCETGRQTYGANEFLENGKICRWMLVSYWPENKK